MKAYPIVVIFVCIGVLCTANTVAAIDAVEENPDRYPSLTIGGLSTREDYDAGSESNTESTSTMFSAELRIPLSAMLTVWGNIERESGKRATLDPSQDWGRMRIGAGITFYFGAGGRR